MNILFMGTPDFAKESLKALFEAGHNILAVVTQPDKPKGRGHKFLPPPVKEFALENNIELYQPLSLKNFSFLESLEHINPEIIVVVAYGKILPEYILNFPKYGCINVHGSLLPKYRGAAPIQWSVLNGDKYAGITTMYMARGMDTGDTLLKEQIIISKDDTSASLYQKLAPIGANTLLETLELIQKGTAKAIAQDEAAATYAPMLDKSMSLINWNNSAWEINCLIRGLNPWPIAHTFYNGNKMKILSSTILEEDREEAINGQIIKYVKNVGLVVKTGHKLLAIEKIQFEGSRPMHIDSYILGHTLNIGEILK